MPVTTGPVFCDRRTSARGAKNVISAVCKFYNVSEKDLFVSKRGIENVPRDVAVYLVRRYCRKTLPSVGRYFGIDNYSTVSSVVERVKTRKINDKSLQKEMDVIWGKLHKSQGRT